MTARDSNSPGPTTAEPDAYHPHEVETKWQERWTREKAYEAKIDPSRPKYYVLDMFPYPSGAGLHVGHPKGYTATDIIARYKHAK
jgi:leucyl-tRNA synthetase